MAKRKRKVDLQIPPELVDCIRAGECILFAGAGLSARAGVPTWNQFLADMLTFGMEKFIVDAVNGASFEEALKQGDRSSVADGLVQSFGERRDLLEEFLAKSFPEPIELSPAHQHLSRIPFAAVVTTNYDTLLEKTFLQFAVGGPFTPKDTELLLDSHSQKRPFLLKLYGTPKRPDTLIFAPIEYREALSANVPFSKFVEALFFSRSFLFIGLDFGGIQDFLSGFVFRGVNTRKHYAVVAVSGTAWKVNAQFLERRYNIRVLDYPISPSFPELDPFVEKLAWHVQPTVPATSQFSAQPEPKIGIRKVILENIGPFEHLELDFSRNTNWKILLGDNGVGKSTVLKAIAAAIVGSDARLYAARLVRAGATRGRITLITELNPSGYITDIMTKDMVSDSEIVSIPSRPLEAESWLALGFSPLRVVSWTPPGGPQTIVQKGRPTSDDLLPLLSGEPDPRMDRLKQWIVNLDAADKSGLVRDLMGHTAGLSSLVFASDGQTLYSGSIDRTIRVWDCWTGKELRRIEAHGGGVNSIALSANDKVLVSGCFDRLTRVWDTESCKLISTKGANQSQVLSVAMSADGNTVVTGSEGGSIRIWDRTLDEPLRRIQSTGGPVWAVASSADGKTLAAGTDVGVIQVCEVATGREIRSYQTQAGGVWSVASPPDGHLFVSGSEDGSVQVWEPAKERVKQVLHGRSDSGALSVAISADGRTAAAGFEDGQVRVWDVETSRTVFATQAHTEGIYSVAFSPDAKTLATGSSDHSIKLWTVNSASGAISHRETIDAFFRLVSDLTDRKIGFARVTEDFRVMVKTDEVSSEIPLEVLSQGQTSLLGWLGILCQRLRETAGDGNAIPTKAYALVLIDELDAHMHPRWQQVLVSRLKNAFPNVQFVACTHSPLIVGGLGREEVERFTIDNGKVVKSDFAADMTLGGTDQILMGDLFSLPSTLDLITEQLSAEYHGLLGKAERSEDETQRFQTLTDMLEERIPPASSSLVERRSRELIETFRTLDMSCIAEARREQLYERVTQLRKALARGNGS